MFLCLFAILYEQDFPNLRNYYIYQIWPNACTDPSANDMLLGLDPKALPFGETPIKILRASLAEGKPGDPGQVTATDNSRIIVACGRGSLALELLQKPGGKPLPVAQFMQSLPIKPGDRFITA